VLFAVIYMHQVTLKINVEMQVGLLAKFTLLLNDLTRTEMCPQILINLSDIKFHKNPFNRYLLVSCLFKEE
jgi:hypothetical protein